ncbi:MAG: DUF502 domain-containing protein [Bacteroidetes bacterium]|nr:DUF502 domain-containing protein [Bacteroidota bacterium]
MNERRLSRILLGYFFRGLLLTVPIAVMAVVAYKALAWLDQIIKVDIPGLGLAILLASITLIGWMGSTFLYQRLAELGDDLLRRIPFLKTVYDTLKDLMEGLVGSKKKFDRPVLVRPLDGSGLEQLGFITQTDLSHLGLPSDRVAVYIPHSFAWSGRLFVVPASAITLIDAKAAEVMKFILSGGVAQVEEE